MKFLDSLEVQVEVSNPQYYPDASAPPIPNINVSYLSESDSSLIGDNETVSITNAKYPRYDTRNPNSYTHMIGVPNTKNYSSDSKTLSISGDHIFYNHLNVDSYIPPFTVMDSYDLDTYFSELAPAVCGLHNYPAITNGTPLLYVHAAHNYYNSFALVGSRNVVLPLDPYLANSSPETNKIVSSSGLTEDVTDGTGDFEVIDYIIRLEKNSIEDIPGGSMILLQNDELEIFIQNFYRSRTGEQFFVFLVYTIDRSGDEPVVSSSSEIFRVSLEDIAGDGSYSAFPNEGKYINLLLRYYPSEPNRPAELITHNGKDVRTWQSPVSYVPWPSSTFKSDTIFMYDSSIVIVGGEYGMPMSIQVVGYKNSDSAPNPAKLVLDYTYPSPHESYYPIYKPPLNTAYPLVFPGYKGNIWDHVNKVSTNLPFDRKVG